VGQEELGHQLRYDVEHITAANVSGLASALAVAGPSYRRQHALLHSIRSRSDFFSIAGGA
jgi:hypothetical protein